MANNYFLSRGFDLFISKYAATVHYTIAVASLGAIAFADKPGIWAAMAAINLPLAVLNGVRVDSIYDEMAAEKTLEAKVEE